MTGSKLGILQDEQFFETMSSIVKEAWNAFAVTDFMKELSNYFLTTGLQQVHFLHNHLDCFPENLSSRSDWQRERFHQHIKTMEFRYQGSWNTNNMAGVYKVTVAMKSY